METKRTRQVDIAEKAGVTTATVSMALRNDPRISETTQNRIKELAKEMNYEPDPAATALAQKHSNQDAPLYLGTVALLCAESHFKQLRRSNRYEKLRNLLEHTCRALGYRLDYFTIESSPKAQRALDRMLKARGIRGLLVHGENLPIADWALDWEHFAVVGYSLSLHSHVFHNVVSASYQDVYEVMIRLSKMGYQRPGFFLPDQGADHLIGGFVAASNHWKKNQKFPKLIFEESFDEALERKKFIEWFKLRQPDVILANYDSRLVKVLSSIGLSIPEDVGYCCLDVFDDFLQVSGIVQPRSEAYRVMADMLHGLLSRHEYGKPKTPLCIQIPSTWNPGTTLRNLNAEP